MMFVPGNSPKMINASDIYGADSLMFDIEDSIAVTEKDTARLLVANALKTLKFHSETVVRINHPTQTPFGIDDLKVILPAKPNLIRMPKIEDISEIELVAQAIEKTEKEYGWPEGTINIIGAIESVKGLYNVREMCKHPRMVAIALGAEDFIANIKTNRTKYGIELYYCREQILMAARDAEIQCLDTVYSDIKDMDTFRDEVTKSRDMGFDGASEHQGFHIGAYLSQLCRTHSVAYTFNILFNDWTFIEVFCHVVCCGTNNFHTTSMCLVIRTCAFKAR